MFLIGIGASCVDSKALADDGFAVPMPQAEAAVEMGGGIGFGSSKNQEPERNVDVYRPGSAKNDGAEDLPELPAAHPGFDTGPNLETDSQPEMDEVEFEDPPVYEMGHDEDAQEAAWIEARDLFEQKGWDHVWPLHHAAVMDDASSIDALCTAGCSPNRPLNDYDNATALGIAASLGHLQAVKVLLRHGADPMAPASQYGGTPAENATREGHAETAAWLDGFVTGRNSR
ncbi:MAG: hypothetical protein Alpg2KO_17200 [Alphaproteobacteria bacterium]